MLDLNYSILDIECLEDYFSVQIKSNKMDEVKVFECYNDVHCKTLYNILSKAKFAMYVYSVDYDRVMLNALFKLVESNTKNIIKHLRTISDYLIKGKLDYFKLNREFWVDGYFKLKENHGYYGHDELFKQSIKKVKSIHISEKETIDFLNNYSFILGQSKCFKNLIINSIPKILYYYVIDKNGTLKPSISLKTLQLYHEGYNVKFDFSKYTKISDIMVDGLFNEFIEYSKNDVLFLEKLFLKEPKKDILKRWYAFKAVKVIKPDVEITNKELYSENNTALISKLLSIKNPMKYLDINYSDYIQTNHPKFNYFVKFVNDNKNITSDSLLKKAYCDNVKRDYIDDDKVIWNDNQIDKLVGSFDELNLNGTVVKFGLGGLHGSIDKIICDNVVHLDYTSQYPSIILQYKEFFKLIMDVDTYEAIYNKRVDSKPEFKKLAKGTPEYEELDNIVNGLKLVLNMLYGLINSNFNIPIACKILGRFICLKGQSLLINLSDKLVMKSPDIKIVNANTDGIICQIPDNINIDDVVEADKDRYLTLGVDKYKKLIQHDVNTYILDHKVKGRFNIRVKQSINRNGQISVNTINAVKLIQGKDVEIYPILFNSKWIDKKETRYYFTDKENGQQAVKLTKKPEILTINNEIMYFTEDLEKADKSLYVKYAEMTKEKILKFELEASRSSMPFIEIELINDTPENITTKGTIKRSLYKCFGKDKIQHGSNFVGFVGFKGNIKVNSYLPSGPIKPLAHYKLTDIQKSTFCQGFSIHNHDNQLIIIDIDAMNKTNGKGKEGYEVINDLLAIIKEYPTMEVSNDRTKKLNRKFIYFNNSKLPYKTNDKYKDYIELLDKAVVWSLPTSESVYDFVNPVKEVPDEVIKELLVKK